MGCLYIIEFSSGKSYIGITKGSAESRVKGHIKAAKAGRNLLVNKAILKYEFTFKTLVVASDIDYLLDLEVKTISLFGTLQPGGYNLTTGGEKSYTYSDEVKKKISESMKGCQRRLGTKHSDEAKLKMRNAKLGRKLTFETKTTMAKSRKDYYSIPENLEKLKVERLQRNYICGKELYFKSLNAIKNAKFSGIPFTNLKGLKKGIYAPA